jgi:2-succinyl-6-hydroxy-2,4-cyclohexadiene-1-carboxylate synthase
MAEKGEKAGGTRSLRVRTVGAGTGVPILLVHGFTGSAEGWGEGILEGLAAGRPVLAADLPGHGESDDDRGPEGFTMDRVVADLLGVLDERKIAAADWVGYSMGARIALAAALRHPKRVRSLVLESGSPGLRAEDARARRRRQDDLLARRIEAQGIEAFVDYWMAQPLFSTQSRLPAAVLGDARRRRLRNRPRSLAMVLRGMGTGSQPSYWGELAHLKLPVLLLTGGLDTRYTALAAEMTGLLPQATHLIVPDAGHSVHLEDPRGWLEAVRPFLRSGEGEPLEP